MKEDKLVRILDRCKPCMDKQNVTHFKQRFNWDCGISCILMILPEHDRHHFLNNFDSICKAENIEKTTWTIDLCYLLKRFNIQHNYFTKTLGIHSEYKEQSYYEKILQKDEGRIMKKFETANANGLIVECKSVSLGCLTKHLELHGPIIILIDSNQLCCEMCKTNKLNKDFRSCLPWPIQYAGHYIVICAFDDIKKKFIYRNPNFKDRLCIVSYDSLDIARKSFGTDEDVILIYNRINNTEQTNKSR